MTLVDKLTKRISDLDLKEKHEDRGHDFRPQSYTHPQQHINPLPYPEEDHMTPYTLSNQSRPHTQSSSYQYHPPRPTPSNLPQGWISLWDQRYQRNYYANQSTGQTQWEVPREERRWEYLYRQRCPSKNEGKVYKAYHPSVYQDRVQSHSAVMAAAVGGAAVGGAAVGGAADEYSDSDYSDSDYEREEEPASEPEDNDEGLSKLNEGLQKFADALSQFSS